MVPFYVQHVVVIHEKTRNTTTMRFSSEEMFVGERKLPHLKYVEKKVSLLDDDDGDQTMM